MNNKELAEHIFDGMCLKPPYSRYQIIAAMEEIARWKDKQTQDGLPKIVNGLIDYAILNDGFMMASTEELVNKCVDIINTQDGGR